MILHYDGATGSPMDAGSPRPLNDVWGASDTDVFAVGGALSGDEPVILHYSCGGA